MNIELPEELQKTLRARAKEIEKSSQEIIIDAIRFWLRGYKYDDR